MPFSDLEGGRRAIVLVGITPVEVTRVDGRVHARSLLCTHMGCRVHWTEAEERYKCTCHGGQYRPDGSPLAGPPPEALKPVAFDVEGETVIFRG